MMIKPARSAATATLANDLAERIRERLQRQPLADGEFFMTEAQIAEEFGASRTVTREAVGRLQALGLLEGRKRKGLLVRHPDPVQLLSNSLPSLAGSSANWKELAQLRYALEVGAIELAVMTASDDEIATLEAITHTMEVALNQGKRGKRIVELDIQFHTQILKMSGSRLIAGMQQVLIEFFRACPPIQPAEFPVERMAWEHRELCRAIRDRDVERARAMIRVQFRMLLTPRDEPVLSE